MNNYKYILEPYKSSKNRYTCPSCGKANQFTMYINTELNEYVGDIVGICNRIEKCGYHLTPKEYFMSLIGSGDTQNYRFKTPEPIAPRANRYNDQISTTYLDRKILFESYKREGKNNFLRYLESIFGEDRMRLLKKEYLIGTTERDNKRVDFFQIDINNNVRQLKNMGYDPHTGKKQNVYFSYPKSRYPNYNLVQCFFGEHLLNKYPDKKVAIVESEKTAIIASTYIDEFVWLAAGNANGLNYDKTKVLKGREVILYPDLGQYNNWKEKISSLSQEATYDISKILINRSTEEEKENGFDLADFLVKTSVNGFRKKKNEAVKKIDPDFNINEFKEGVVSNDDFWSEYGNEIIEYEKYFEVIFNNGFNTPIMLNNAEKVNDPRRFIESHLKILKSTKKIKVAMPYMERIRSIQKQIGVA